MAKKATYDAWLEDTQKRLKSDEQKKALEVLLGDEAVKESVFGGHLREQDYYKKVNEFNASKQELADEAQKLAANQKEWREWRESAQEQLDEALREKAELERRMQYGDVSEDDTNPTAVSKVTPQMRAEFEELRKEVELANKRTELLDSGSTRLIVDMAQIMRESFKSGIDVDPAAIVQYQIDNKCDPRTAFDALTRDERAANWQKEQEKRLQEARDEGYKKAKQESGHAPDYIPRGGPSTVEFFTTNANLGDSNSRLKAATDMFYKLDDAGNPRK
jgi:hypothetical protein